MSAVTIERLLRISHRKHSLIPQCLTVRRVRQSLLAVQYKYVRCLTHTRVPVRSCFEHFKTD